MKKRISCFILLCVIISVSAICSVYGLSEEKTKELMVFDINGASCALVPIMNTKEHKECMLSLFANADKNYMKYYLSGKLRSAASTEKWHAHEVNVMKQKKPRSFVFIIDCDDESVGRIGVGPLHSTKGINGEIGYALKKEASGKGITTAAVKQTLLILDNAHSMPESVYKLKKLRATAKKDNKASNRILQKLGFELKPKLINNGYGPENEYFYYF